MCDAYMLMQMVYLTPHAIYLKIQRVLMHMNKGNPTYAMCLLLRHNGQLDREGTFVDMPENVLEDVKRMMFLAEINLNLSQNLSAFEWLDKTKKKIKAHVFERRIWQQRLVDGRLIGDLDVLPKDVLVSIATLI